MASSIAVGFVPVRLFTDNIGYASHVGLTVRYQLENSPHGKNSVFQNSKFWNNDTGITLPYSQNIVLQNDRIIRNASSQQLFGITGNSVTSKVTYTDLAISGYYVGIELPRLRTHCGKWWLV